MVLLLADALSRAIYAHQRTGLQSLQVGNKSRRSRLHPAANAKQNAAHRSREKREKAGERHDEIDIVETNRVHQQKAESSLRCEHLTQKRPD